MSPSSVQNGYWVGQTNHTLSNYFILIGYMLNQNAPITSPIIPSTLMKDIVLLQHTKLTFMMYTILPCQNIFIQNKTEIEIISIF